MIPRSLSKTRKNEPGEVIQAGQLLAKQRISQIKKKKIVVKPKTVEKLLEEELEVTSHEEKRKCPCGKELKPNQKKYCCPEHFHKYK